MASRQASSSSFVTSIVVSSRYIPVWIAIGLLLVVALIIAPNTLQPTSLSVALPQASFLAIAALGQMFVIMVGGIDLSVPGIMTLSALVTVGVAHGADDRIALAILAALLVSCIAGLVNGMIIGLFKLSPVIVTLAVGQIVKGILSAYSDSVTNEAAVPKSMSTWATTQFLSISWIFWVGITVVLLVALFIRYTEAGRRFQSVGANPVAAWIAGIRVSRYVVFAYAVAGLLYGLAGVLFAAFYRSPSLTLGDAYLLSPIAAVVIGGASLTGGLASALSTWAAAIFLSILNKMLGVLHLSTALQFVAFGVAIVGGMIISGDRIITVVEAWLRGRFNFSDTARESSLPDKDTRPQT